MPSSSHFRALSSRTTGPLAPSSIEASLSAGTIGEIKLSLQNYSGEEERGNRWNSRRGPQRRHFHFWRQGRRSQISS